MSSFKNCAADIRQRQSNDSRGSPISAWGATLCLSRPPGGGTVSIYLARNSALAGDGDDLKMTKEFREDISRHIEPQKYKWCVGL